MKKHLLGVAIAGVLIAIAGAAFVMFGHSMPSKKTSPPQSTHLSSAASSPSVSASVVHPAASAASSGSRALPLSNPDGSPQWPSRSGDLNIQMQALGSVGSIFIHNGTAQGIYAKLCLADGSSCAGVRHVYILPKSDWPITGIAAGGYQLRIRTTESPFFAAASDAFELSTELANAHVYIQLPAPQDGSRYVIGMKPLDVGAF